MESEVRWGSRGRSLSMDSGGEVGVEGGHSQWIQEVRWGSGEVTYKGIRRWGWRCLSELWTARSLYINVFYSHSIPE